MLLLHAAWSDRRFLFWAEAPEPAAQSRTARGIPAHPRAASRARLGEALGLDLPASTRAIAWLPTRDGSPVSEDAPLAPWTVPAFDLSAEATIAFLSNPEPPGTRMAPDAAYWARALRFGASLAVRGHMLPTAGEDAQGFYASWEPALVGPDLDAFASLTRAMPGACRALGDDPERPPEVPRHQVLKAFLDDLIDHWAREAKQSRHPAYTLHDVWVQALGSPTGAMTGNLHELRRLVTQIKNWRRPVDIQAPYRILFRLEEPRDEGPWRVGIHMAPADDPSLVVDARTAWEGTAPEARLLQRGEWTPREALLAGAERASRLCPPLAETMVRSAVPEGFTLDARGAHAFLTEHAPRLSAEGFVLQLPAWWGPAAKRRLSASLSVESPRESSGLLSLDALAQFNYKLALGGEELSAEELARLAQAKAPLVEFRGQWIEVEADTLEKAADFLQKRGSGEVRARDVLREAMGATGGPADVPLDRVEATGWLGSLLDQLRDPSPVERLEAPADFQGTLRPYQQRGLSWLHFLTRWGFGACLADDMGLGKTIQMLAFLLHDRAQGATAPVLLVAPTSVVGNWQREAERFAPDLPVWVHHGTDRVKGEAFREQAMRHGLVVTSYALLQRDRSVLESVAWRGVVLDEAQNVKNPAAKQSQAARALTADYKIALTGTPVENHLADLWSLMEFLNPGWLGSQAAFRREFASPIQLGADPQATERLKRLTSPFVLRRLKTDPSIIRDLPEKQELKVFCPLTKEQASLYAAVVEELTAALAGAEGIQRKGLVLAALTKLKQVCNHPAQFLGDGSPLPGRSGKLARLTEMLEECLEEGDRALLFTQFREMGTLLQRHLEERFGREVLFLHGGVPKAKRDRMVRRFQEDEDAPPLFVLSLKAGGTGLTLTRANRVFHFDRWWNPAVENQATDRAFRIGQRRNVWVHKFVCQGTLEDRIDQLIEQKKALADQVVGTGENWLTELSAAELRELFALRPEALEV